MMSKRIEQDARGHQEVPGEVYWGVHTGRALANFQISALKVSHGLITAFAKVKKAACEANAELGFLPQDKARAVRQACDELMDGKFAEQFQLDALQGGAGTSTNMNVNEVLANRALEILGAPRGDYAVIHPIEDVNRHQSTNDTYPTALKIAAIEGFRRLSGEIANLQGVFQKKEKEFADVVTIARTELQEAVPITLGAEFASFAEAFARDRWRAFKCEERLRVINLGGTAVGTGLGAPRSYIFLVIEKLNQISGLGLCRGENMIDQTANTDTFVEVSGILKAHASNLVKVANDLRLLSALGEVELPKLQAGSSIMPGKVNPVILEAVIQAGIKAMANDVIVAETTSRSTLQINEFMPLLAYALLESLDILIQANKHLAGYVEGIRADKERCRWYAEHSETIVTAFLPHIGYDKAGELIKEFRAGAEKNLRVFLDQKLGTELVQKVLSPASLNSLGYRNHE
ncbi:MAG: aspartate ammonia-lyase [Candidatus Omnitrophica bacterium]|nr:aspartate ammonia-lyase [Candidatus Omnitrophota bacterium]